MKLRQAIALIPPFLIFLIFSGCYDTPFPVDSAENSSFDQALIGKWERTNDLTARSASVEVSQLNEKEYQIIYSDEQRGEFRLRAHRSEHAGFSFLNLKSLEGEDTEYSLVSYRLHDSEAGHAQQISLNLLRVTLPHFDSAEELRAFISTHKDHPSVLFEQAMVFERK